MHALDELPGPTSPALLNVIAYGFAPRPFARRRAAAFGRTYRVRSGGSDLVFTSEPEHLRRIFAADSDTFRTFSATSLAGLLGPRSVLVTAGPLHKSQRKLLSPPLTGPRLRAFGATMQELAERRVAALKPGAHFRALDLTTDFTLDVIIRTVFGVASESDGAPLRALLHGLVHELPRLPLFAPQLQHPRYPPWARYLRIQRRFDAWLAAKLTERRKAGGEGGDVLSLLLAARHEDGAPMDDAEIRDQLVTLLLAGHETTAVSLATCLERVHRHPRVLERLSDELAGAQSPEEAQRLPYLSAVIDETLRLDPVVTDVTRIPRSDFALDERLTVTPQQLLLVLIEALHQDPLLYPEPALFRPERFLERKFAPYEFAPFGGGVRRCLGAAFSDYETKILLATLLRTTRLRLVDERDDRRVRRNVTMGPSRGVRMAVVEAGG